MSGRRPPTVASVLAASTLPALEARALLAHQLNVAREHLIAHPDQSVGAVDATAFDRLVERRLEGEPLAYLLGEKEFYGRMFVVSPAVLVPRPESELLVDLALARVDTWATARVLDLGTGSGCIAITIALERLRSQVIATDASDAALDLARKNAARHDVGNIRFEASDWFATLPVQARFDVIVSNPPYVAANDPHLCDLRFEPALALCGGDDGLAALRTIVEEAADYLTSGGWLVLEHGYQQGSAVRAMLSGRSWNRAETHTDAAGLERVTVGRTV